MKTYDKELYNTQQRITTTAILTLIFILGFAVGYITRNIDEQMRQLEVDGYRQEYPSWGE